MSISDSKLQMQTFADDLLWIANSPSLIHPNAADSSPFPPLSADDIDGDHLARFISERSTHRVGYYFENLFEFWIETIPGYEMLAHRWRIEGESGSLGELDFVFRDPAGQTIHCEIAVKFYLHSQRPHSTGSFWIGPNSHDTFERKINRLFDHQLPMSRHWPEPIDRRIPFVKGRIYDHPLSGKTSELPAIMSPEHLHGLWLSHHEAAWLEGKAWRYYKLDKPYWLSGLGVGAKATPRDYSQLRSELERHFQDSIRPWHLAAVEETESGWREVTRLFIVDDEWPTEDR